MHKHSMDALRFLRGRCGSSRQNSNAQVVHFPFGIRLEKNQLPRELDFGLWSWTQEATRRKEFALISVS